MQIFRITRPEYSDSLIGSGRENRWNKRGEKVIYTAGSRSLACLENVVHSSGEALEELFTTMVIYVPDDVAIHTINLPDLPEDWHKFARPPECQELGSQWLLARRSAVLRVPSAIVNEENNFVLNPDHPDFGRIMIIDKKPFAFDKRIKLS